jgi:hypothetical protein
MKNLCISLVGILLVSQLALAGTSKNSWENLSQLKPGQKIEVTDMKDKSFKGEFIAFSADSISLREGVETFVIGRSDVTRVKNLEKKNRVRGGVLGALLGAVAGAAAGAVITSSVADSSETGYGAGIGFYVGAAGGVAAGLAWAPATTIYEITQPPIK